MSHSIAPTWDDYAGLYEAVHEPLTRQFAAAALQRAPLRSGERVLDVAAGPGTLAMLAAACGAEVSAIDTSPRMIARLQERVRESGLGRVEGRIMDGSHLAFADASFDAVFCVFGIMLIPDYRAALAEMGRVTKPGGRVAIVMWNGLERMEHVQTWLRAVSAAFPSFAPTPPPESWTVLQDALSLRRIMESAGFATTTVETETCWWEVPSPAWFAAHADLSPAADILYRSLGPDARGRVRWELERQLRERHGEAPFRLAAEAHIAVGRRSAPAHLRPVP
jgi:ubiquinone/menaquinone biosynthesis C-methylase UbiE